MLNIARDSKINRFLAGSVVLVLHFMILTKNQDLGRIFYAVGLGFTIALFMQELIPVFLVFLFFTSTRYYFPPELKSFPSLPFLIPFLLMVIIFLPFKKLRKELDWFRAGSMDRFTVGLTLLTGVVSTIALNLWGYWSDNMDRSISFATPFASQPKYVIFGLIVPIFAIVNAFSEEVIFRGVLQNSLDKIFGERNWVTHVLQAAAFAIVHFAGGFPNGKIGYLMVFVYGLMLGYLRMRSKGMLAPYLAHVLADLTIGYFLFLQALR